MTPAHRRTWLNASVQTSNEVVIQTLADLCTNHEQGADVPLSPLRSQTLQPDRGDNCTPDSSEESQVEDDEDSIEKSPLGGMLRRVKEED